MTEIHIGLIGAGAIARSACTQLKNHPAARLRAVADPSEERRGKLAEAQGIERTYATADELLADATVDAVYIATPNALHAEQALAAIAAGKHVLLEKPFAPTLAQAEAVAAAARAADTVFALGMNQRFTPPAQRARRLVADGALGRVYHAKACWLRREGIPGMGSWFTRRELSGGGCLMDIGVHLLDLALYVMDDFAPTAVLGRTYAEFGPRGLGAGGWGDSERDTDIFDVDDFATALITLESGCSLSLDVAWALHQMEPNRMGVQLYGTDAGYHVQDRVLCRSGTAGSYELVQDPAVGSPEEQPGHCRFGNFLDAILGEAEPCVGLDEALAVQRILDGIATSCRTGAAVRLDSTTASTP